MADFPGGIYSPRTKQNKAGVVYDPDKPTTLFADDIAKLDAEVVALETLVATRAPRIGTIASSATPTPSCDNNDIFIVTALAQAAEFGAPTGTPANGQKLIIRILDDSTPRALSWNAAYRAGSDIALPTTTVSSKTLYCGFIYNAADAFWDLVAVTNNI